MLLDCHREFATAVTTGRASAIDAAEGTRVVELVNALYLSAVRDEPVELPLPTGDYAKIYEQLCDGSLAVPGAPRR
ncbi:MAG: hypothetical protein QOI55_1628, partial [Actinomycetota bacterium]|nr:hypothetical protein [Actinomycetota bacterium]